ncbi:MAG: hypothetical protein TREMPRED_004456 [Tremellales sp. Tagirdzhanova-0007]|nr:MAG: hypothetical protein TREMPRED_004456 [Tremellales sp. Tagirdzhanova-0007]
MFVVVIAHELQHFMRFMIEGVPEGTPPKIIGGMRSREGEDEHEGKVLESG